MTSNKFKTTQTFRTTLTQQAQNPQNVFSKLMGLQLDKDPLTECRMLLDGMKEQYNFERNMFTRTFDQLVPRSVTSDRVKRQNYQNYQKLLSYSKKKQTCQDFAKRAMGKINVQVKKNRAQTLKQFINQKKVKMLTEQSKEQFNDALIQGLLNNDKTRQKLFDESILLERLYFIKKEQQKNEVDICPIPNKFKGLDPKHLRVPQNIKDQSHFHRRKYIHYQKSYQYFRKALNTESNLLKNKEKQNTLVLMNLMNHFKDQVLSTKSADKSSQVNMCIHRLFLKYASSGSEDVNTMYKKITKQNIYKLMEDFELDYKKNTKVEEIIERYQITQFYFLEIIHLLSQKEGQEFVTDTNQFIMDKILSRPEIYLPREWQLISKHEQYISKHIKIRRFKEKLQLINSSLIKFKQQSGYINFDEMVQVMWALKIYPFLISKKKLRFFYLYTQSEETGITIDNLIDIYLCVAVSRDGNLEQNIKEIVGMVVNYGKSKKKS